MKILEMTKSLSKKNYYFNSSSMKVTGICLVDKIKHLMIRVIKIVKIKTYLTPNSQATVGEDGDEHRLRQETIN